MDNNDTWYVKCYQKIDGITEYPFKGKIKSQSSNYWFVLTAGSDDVIRTLKGACSDPFKDQKTPIRTPKNNRKRKPKD